MTAMGHQQPVATFPRASASPLTAAKMRARARPERAKSGLRCCELIGARQLSDLVVTYLLSQTLGSSQPAIHTKGAKLNGRRFKQRPSLLTISIGIPAQIHQSLVQVGN
jgi:hypothetical protein